MDVSIIFSFLPAFSVPCLAVSFSSDPICALIHDLVHFFALHAKFSRASAVFNAILDLKSIMFKACSANYESVSILILCFNSFDFSSI